MELQIYNPRNDDALKPIEWNFEELKAWLTDALQKYDGMVFADMQTAKAERAKLNTLSKAIDGKRIELKKKYLEPYSLFEAQCKELTGMISEVSNEIDSQVKAQEEAEKQAKLEEIKAFYAENIGDLKDLLPYDRLHDPKWLNKGTSMKSIKESILETIDKVKYDMETIGKMVPEQMKPRIIARYFDTLDISSALRLKDEIEAEEKRLAEYERQQKEAAADQAPVCATVEEEAPEEPTEQLIQLDFRVWVTKGQLSDLKQFLIKNNIKYDRVI